MPGDSINEAIGIGDGAAEFGAAAPEQMAAAPARGGFAIPEFLKAQTGEGSVGDYIEHPLNFNGSQHMARMLRGLTGMLGSLNYAIVDVVIGALGFLKDKRKVVQPVANSANP